MRTSIRYGVLSFLGFGALFLSHGTASAGWFDYCPSPTLALCEATTAEGDRCRIEKSTECRNLVQADLEKKAATMGDARMNIIPEGKPNAGAIVWAKSQKTPMSGLKVTGLSSTFRTSTYAQSVARYAKAKGNLALMDSSIRSGATKADQWAQTPGYESCDEFASEVFPDLTAVEGLLDVYGPDGAALITDLAIAHSALSSAADFGKLPWLRTGPVVPAYQQEVFPWPIAWVQHFDQGNKSLSELVNAPWTEENEPHHWVTQQKLNPGSVSYAKNPFLIAPPHWYPIPRASVKCGAVCDPNTFLPANSQVPLDPTAMAEIQKLAQQGAVDTKPMSVTGQYLIYSSLTNTMKYSPDYMSETFRLEEQYARLIKRRRELATQFDSEMFLHWDTAIYETGCPEMACGSAYYSWQAAQKYALTILPELQQIDSQLRELQGKALKYGCIKTGLTPCDISPQLMRQSVESGIRRARNYREKIRSVCQAVTVQKAIVRQLYPGGPSAIVGTYMYPRADYLFILGTAVSRPFELISGFSTYWKNNPEHFKSFFKAALSYNAHIADEQAEVEKFSTAVEGSERRLGQKASDSGYVGTTILGGETGGRYNYNVNWMVKDYKTRLCDSNISVHYDFAASAKLLGADVAGITYVSEFATAGNTVNYGVTMNVAGQELTAGESKAVNYHFINDVPMAPKKIASASQIVPVLGVPVTFRASLDANVGFRIDMESSATRSCGSKPFTDTDTVRLSAKGEIGPYAGLLLSVSGSVDAGIAEIGLRGTVSLVELGLPLKINHQLSQRVSDNKLVISPSSQLDLRLVTLGGRLSAFFDSPFTDFEVDLLSWGGLGQSYELLSMKTNKTYSIKFACQQLNKACYESY